MASSLKKPFKLMVTICAVLVVICSAHKVEADDCRRVKNILILFDASGFMNERGRWKGFLKNMGYIEQSIPLAADGFFKVGLRHYGLKVGMGCKSTESILAIQTWDPDVFLNAFPKQVSYGISTLSAGLRAAADDISGVEGKSIIMVIGGGMESCRADPIKIAQQICLNNPDLEIHTFSMAGTGQEGEFFLRSIAEQCRGTYNRLRDMGSPAGWYAWMKRILVEPCRVAQPKPPVQAGPPQVPPVLFDINSYSVRSKEPTINASNLAALDVVGKFLQKLPHSSVVLHGYTDGKGSQKTNLALSRRRANSVKKYLMSKYGINTKRITVYGHGIADPSLGGEAARISGGGRRVEFELFP
jgi:outer membrane protein OmpA-like peptidoglycan-associated protein